MLKIAAAVLVQFAVLAGMVVYYSIPYYSSTEIVVRSRPVDPRHPFYGDYVVLGYDFNQLEGAKPDFLEPRERYNGQVWYDVPSEYYGRTVYTLFVPDENAPHLWRAEKTTLTPPESGVYLTGKLEYRRIEYGIEQYYVQAGTGMELENAIRRGSVEVTLGVAAGGRAGVKGVKIVEDAAPESSVPRMRGFESTPAAVDEFGDMPTTFVEPGPL